MHRRCTHDWELTQSDRVEWCERCGSIREEVGLSEDGFEYKVTFSEMYRNFLRGVISYG